MAYIIKCKGGVWIEVPEWIYRNWGGEKKPLHPATPGPRPAVA